MKSKFVISAKSAENGTKFLKFLIFAISSLIIFIIIFTTYFLTQMPIKNQAAIVTNGLECAKMGREIFEAGGNVADAAVTVVLCEGVASPQSSGIGGGFLLSMYIKSEKKVITLNAREVAPKASYPEMFKDKPNASTKGGLAVAVPSEIKGLFELHKAFGTLPWSTLLKPVISLCRTGSEVSSYLENILKELENSIREEETLREIFMNKSTNRTYQRGEKVKRIKLAETLEEIAEKGADVVYGGEIGRKIAEDVKERGGILSEEDFLDYQVEWSTPISSILDKQLSLHSMSLPSSASIINFIFNIIDNYRLNYDSLSFHRMTEAMKFAYAKRTFLGDDNSEELLEIIEELKNKNFANFIKSRINDTHTYDRNVTYYGAKFSPSEDHGTAHMSILAPNGDAISVTSSINFKLGALLASKQTGIILNNQMDDFSTPGVVNVYGIPPSPANFVRPGKRPMSSMSPTIVMDLNGDLRLIIGAAGGSRIPTGVIATIFHHILMKKSLNEAISARRLHHQLVPYELQYESGFDEKTLKDLSEKFGHELLENKLDGGFAAVTAISVVNGKVEAAFDPRRGGSVEIF